MVAENFDFQECLCDAQLLSCLLHHSPLCHRFSSIVHQRKIWNNGKKNVYRIDSNLYFICTIIFIAGAFVFSPQKLRENEWHKHLFRLFEMQKQWEKKGKQQQRSQWARLIGCWATLWAWHDTLFVRICLCFLHSKH